MCDTTYMNWLLFCFEYQSMFQGRDLYRYNLSNVCVTNDGRRRLETSVKFMFLSLSYELRDVLRISSYILIYCFCKKEKNKNCNVVLSLLSCEGNTEVNYALEYETWSTRNLGQIISDKI